MPELVAMPNFSTMIARLLLALLLAAFAVPSAAPAACHDAPTTGHAMPSPADMTDRHALPVHACIGCVPPSDWLSARFDTPMPPIVAQPVAAPTALLTGTAPPPDLPPPRRG